MVVEEKFSAQATAAAARGEHVIVLLDRGACDGAAYCEREDWLALLQRNGMDEVTF